MKLWDRWLRLWFQVGRDIKPPMGYTPWALVSVWHRYLLAAHLYWWRAHVLLDQRLGRRRREAWDKAHRPR